MTFDQTRTFDIDNGIVLDQESGVAIFSGTGSPVGTAAPQTSYYFDKADGLMWYKHGVGDNDWRQVRPEFFRDHNNIFNAGNEGFEFNSSSYEVISNGHISGTDEFPNNQMHMFYAIGRRSSGGGSVNIRLFDTTNTLELAAFNFTETVPTLKSAVISPNTVESFVEVQARRNGGGTKGEIYTAFVVSNRSEL